MATYNPNLENFIGHKWTAVQAYLWSTIKNKRVLSQLLDSRYDAVVYCELVRQFGRDNVFYKYGIHSTDPRYPHNCSFYIKGLDLFIELYCDRVHGSHWFDEGNSADVMRREHLLAAGAKKNLAAVDTWCRVDLLKRADAQCSGIKFLVFWDGRCSTPRQGSMPLLTDFYMWFRDYGCDYDRFIADHPENTY